MQLGSFAVDSVTGFAGVVVANVQYITGCNQCLIQPRVKADGDYVESRWVDEDRLVRDAGQKAIELPRRVSDGPDKSPPRR